jgi:hypothetical protein
MEAALEQVMLHGFTFLKNLNISFFCLNPKNFSFHDALGYAPIHIS